MGNLSARRTDACKQLLFGFHPEAGPLLVMRHCHSVAPDEIGVLWRSPSQGATVVDTEQKAFDAASEGAPQWLVIGLEHCPLCALVDALFDEEKETTHRDVLPFGELSRGKCAGTPDANASARQCPERVDSRRDKMLLIGVRERAGQTSDGSEASLSARWCLP